MTEVRAAADRRCAVAIRQAASNDCANLAKSGRPFAVVENVIVATAWRRKGIGRALVEHAVAAAREAGCYKLMLATGQESMRNRQFCGACGFSGDKVGFQVRYDD
jgi:GNAT superfamily N-acetyltransferase